MMRTLGRWMSRKGRFQGTPSRGPRGAAWAAMLAASMHLFALFALLIGIVVVSAEKTMPGLFIGLTLVICAIMVFCTGAIVAAVNALRRSSAGQPPQQGHYPPP